MDLTGEPVSQSSTRKSTEALSCSISSSLFMSALEITKCIKPDYTKANKFPKKPLNAKLLIFPHKMDELYARIRVCITYIRIISQKIKLKPNRSIIWVTRVDHNYVFTCKMASLGWTTCSSSPFLKTYCDFILFFEEKQLELKKCIHYAELIRIRERGCVDEDQPCLRNLRRKTSLNLHWEGSGSRLLGLSFPKLSKK